MWTGENDLNTVTCGRGTFRNRENIYPVLNLHGYVWTGPKLSSNFSMYKINKANLNAKKNNQTNNNIVLTVTNCSSRRDKTLQKLVVMGILTDTNCSYKI